MDPFTFDAGEVIAPAVAVNWCGLITQTARFTLINPMRWRFPMDWLREAFLCNTWGEFFACLAVALVALPAVWALLVIVLSLGPA